MARTITGLHHVTAFAKDPRANLDFYTRVLGLRLIKKTVNFDDPFTYHLYYGDHAGSPGTLLTHFPNPMAARARHGSNEIQRTTLAVGVGALGFWRDRLAALGVEVASVQSFGQDALHFDDHDGMRFRMIEQARPLGVAEDHEREGIAAGRAIAGIAGVDIHVQDAGTTIAFLRDVLGFEVERSEGAATWLSLHRASDGPIEAAQLGQRLVVVEDASAHMAMGAGTVHHVAWRAADLGTQARAVDAIRAARVGVTPVIDRQYFQSIYFRIPGGVVFEIATDAPGFATDETLEGLGSALRLPPQHERLRSRLEKELVPLDGAAR